MGEGASTCASGSHVWNGTRGSFTANPMNDANSGMYSRLTGIWWAWSMAWMVGMSKEGVGIPM